MHSKMRKPLLTFLFSFQMGSRAQKILNMLKNDKKQEETSFVKQDDFSKENYDTLNFEPIETSEEYNYSLTDNLQSSQVFVVQADGSLVQISDTVTSTDTTVIAIDSLPLSDENLSMIISDDILGSNAVSCVNDNTNGIMEENSSISYNPVSQQANNENENTLITDDNHITKETTESPKRKKRHKVNEKKWESKKAKISREKGEEYQGRKMVDGKSKFSVIKPKRKMKDVKCKCKSLKFHCASLSVEQRTKIFKQFWEMSWEGKKMYVRGLIDVTLTGRARDRKEPGQSRRTFTYQFHLTVDHRKLRVCKSTFLATLGIGDWMALNWIKEKEDIDVDDKEAEDINKIKSKREKAQNNVKSKRKDLIERNGSMKDFFSSLPKVESHYCRSSSNKLYLEPYWSSKAKLYEFYCNDWCKQKNKIPLSTCTFHKMFEDLNLSLYRPKKDQCDTCIAFKHNHIDKKTYDDHIKKKEDARKSKEFDKANEEHVYTVDLQSLLLSPKSNASALYYRCKLSVHNMTVFDLKSKDGFCYLWNESEGELTGNEFASILTDFIVSQLPLRNNSNKVIIYSDGCNYQNRCATLANALMHLAKRYNISIEQKYLEKGHTQMECDSIHSTIERYVKYRDIHVPADYADVCTKARKNPRPYKVKYLDHTFFKDYGKAMPHKSIRPGVGVGQPKVTDIRCLLFTEDAKMYYKLNYEDDYKLLPVCEPKESKTRRSRRKETTTACDDPYSIGQFDFPQLYTSRRKIPRSKYNHLQELKQTMPSDYHSFYDSLPTE